MTLILPEQPRAREAAWLLLAIVVWLALTAWARPLMLPDEGRYVGVALEMLRSGDWLTPTQNGMPFFHKPPLFYWITAASMSVFGINEWAARLASVLGAAAGAFALCLFAWRWCGPRVAGAVALVLVTLPMFYAGGQFANLDMLVAGCISVTIVLLAHTCLDTPNRANGKPDRRALAGAWLFAALGMLAKGLIGIVLPGAVILLWLVITKRWRAILALLWPPGIVLFLAVAAPWFVAMQLRFPDFLNYFFVVQHFKRFAQTGFNNVQPFWFYPVVLALLCLPWVLWLHRAVRPSYLRDRWFGDVRLLMWIWLAVIVGFFTLPSSKLIGYVLPAVPPLAFLIADGALSLGLDSRRARRLWWGSAALAVIIGLSAVIGLSLHYPKSMREVGHALQAQHRAGEPVIFIRRYYFDLPFYAGLRERAIVVDDWSDPEVRQGDSWRKELVDAGEFVPEVSRKTLLEPPALVGQLCAHRISWVVASEGEATKFPFLAQAQKITTARDGTLWKVDLTQSALVSALHCPEKPSADSPDK